MKGLLCRTVQFEFQHVGVILRLQNHVDASLARMVLGTHVHTKQPAEDEQHVLIMVLTLTDQFVRRIGKEAFQAGEEGIGLTRADFLHKILDMERRFHLVHRSIERQKKTEEAVFNLGIGKAQLVSAEFRVIPLDGQVTALVDDGDGIRGGHIHTVENILRGILVGHAFQTIIMQL